MKATIQLVGAAALLAMLLSGCRGNSMATPTTALLRLLHELKNFYQSHPTNRAIALALHL